MSPRLAPDNPCRVGDVNAELGGDVACANTSIPPRSDSPHGVVGKFRAGDSFALVLPLLGNHVVKILPVRPEEQVPNVAARWVVAAVTNVQTDRDRSDLDLPHGASGEHSTLASHAYHSVAVAIRASNPRPASIIAASAVNLFPEAISEGTDALPGGCAKIAVHLDLLSRVPRLGLLTQRRGFVVSNYSIGRR